MASRTSWWRPALALARIALHLVVGLVIVGVLFRVRAAPDRRRMVRWWSGQLLRIARVRVRVVGPEGVMVYRREAGRSDTASSPPPGVRIVEETMRPGGPGAMLVLNHVSWADIFVVDTVRPACFVAKAEIATWPIVGYLTDRTGTIFIERGRRHAVREANQRATQLLRAGELIAMFPEGTTGDGDRLLPFHANLLQPAIDAGVPIIVGGIRYLDRRGRASAAAAFVGELTMVQSLVRMLHAGPLTAELHLIEAVDTAGLSRHALARHARAVLARRLGFDDESGEAAAGLASVLVDTPSARVTRAAGRPDRAPGTAIDPRDELL